MDVEFNFVIGQNFASIFCHYLTPMLSGPLFSNPMSTNQSIAIEIGRGLAKIANPLPIRMN